MAITPTIRALLLGMAARGVGSDEELASVVCITRAIALRLGLEDAMVHEAGQVALLKDVGMLALPDALMHTDAALDDRQRQALCQAPTLAADLVAGLAGLEHLADGVGAVRERWDGSGYPGGRAGEEIPVVARVVAVADAYDALMRDRPYRPALSRADTLQIMAMNAGSQFWPDAVAALAAEAGAEAPAEVAPSEDRDGGAPPARPGPRSGRSRTAELVHAAFAAASDREPAGGDETAAVHPGEDDVERALPAARPAPTLHRPRLPLPAAAYGAAALIGSTAGLLLALPFEDVTTRCPPAGEGLVQCQLQKAYLPALMIVLGCLVCCLVLLHVAVVSGPALYRRWSDPELRRTSPPRFDEDPLLRAANRGLTYRDAHPERLVGRKRTWTHGQGEGEEQST